MYLSRSNKDAQVKAFITGTDTDVGKTTVIALLSRALRRAGLDTIALKPICCGERKDVEILRAATENELSLDEMNPFWLKTPVAPLVAARSEKRSLSIPFLTSWFQRISSNYRSVLVEGAGGWLVPITEKTKVADMAVAFDLPVIIVTANRLGCINHTLLTLESIRAHGLQCSGIILNNIIPDSDEATRTNRDILHEVSGLPILIEIAYGQDELEFAVA